MGDYEALEKCVFVDPGNRGIGGMWTHGCLERIIAEIWKCDRNKPSYVLTGFCCKGETTETDGPLGSAILCAMLRAVGFNTFLLTDRNSSRVVIAAAGECPVMVTDDPKVVRDPAFIVSVERPARSAKSGRFCTMTARDITSVTAPLDELFPLVGEWMRYLTIGVGDGGNEVGTGNVADEVRKSVPHGDEICVSRGCDILLMSGVSNWGALAIAAAIALSSKQINTYIELSDRQPEILQRMVDAGSYDGCTGKCELSIDGMPWDKEHAEISAKIKEILQKKS